jgi:lysophospholipase L1-like esterase
MKTIPIIAIFLFVATSCRMEKLPPLTIHLVGDSTMADKFDPQRNPERGWGQMLHLCFNEKVTIRNHAVNGRSTRSFLNEGRWNLVLGEICSGDYVFIQFGHNDQKAYDPDRYSHSFSGYRRNLEKMVRETRSRGGHPVILSSIVRRNFNADGTLVDTHGPYPFVARTVAYEMGVPFIDLQQLTEDLVSGLGPVRSTALYLHLLPGESEMYPEGRTDNTHLNLSGAREVAGMVARSVYRQKLPLSAYLEPSIMQPRALVVTGGHSYDTAQFVNMFRVLKEIRFDTLSHPHVRRLLASEYIFDYDVLLFYDFQPSLPPEDSTLYVNLTLHGMPMLFLHHSICSYQHWDGFMEMVGGRYIMEGYGSDTPQLSEYTHDLEIPVKVVDQYHPVTSGMENFTIHDEGYLHLQMSEGITPLLTTDHPGCSSPLAWTKEHGSSTIVYLMLGHDRHAYENDALRKLLSNSLHWLSGTKGEF